MRSVLHLAAFTALATSLLAQSAPPPSGVQNIVAVHQNGRIVYENKEEPAPAATASLNENVRPRYIYWSNKEHRWKSVPTPNIRQLRAARSAVSDVNLYIAGNPGAQLPVADAKVNAAIAAKPTGPGVDHAAKVLDPAALKAEQKEAAKDTAAMSMAERVDAAIDRAASKHGVDPNLVRAIIQQESKNNPNAISRKGAIGLMQLMPGTARALNVNPYDPEQNIEGGVKHFRGLLDNFNGNVALSLAAYNAGQGAVERNGGIPPYAETKAYVKRITQMYGNGTGTQAPQASPNPIRVTRDRDGHLVFTNE